MKTKQNKTLEEIIKTLQFILSILDEKNLMSKSKNRARNYTTQN